MIDKQENQEKVLLFEAIWDQHQDQFDHAIDQGDIDEAHRIWCLAAEQFLHAWFHEEEQHKHSPLTQLPNSKPRRGTPLPYISNCIAEKYSNLSEAAVNDYSTTAASFLGKVRFL